MDNAAARPIDSRIDVTHYPLDDDLGEGRQALVAQCRRGLEHEGSFSLDGFLRPEALAACVGEDDPNYDGVPRLLAAQNPEVRSLPLRPGTLNVFAGRYAAHRLQPVEGGRTRLVAILTFMDEPQVMFRPDDRHQFYGRTE